MPLTWKTDMNDPGFAIPKIT